MIILVACTNRLWYGAGCPLAGCCTDQGAANWWGMTVVNRKIEEDGRIYIERKGLICKDN